MELAVAVLLGTTTVTSVGMQFVGGYENALSYQFLATDRSNNNEQLKELKFRGWVDSVGGYEETESLEKVVLPTSVRFIDEGAYRDCPNLDEIVALGFLQLIGKEAFKGCSSLRRFVLFAPGSLIGVGANAFSGCPEIQIGVPDITTDQILLHLATLFRGGGAEDVSFFAVG